MTPQLRNLGFRALIVIIAAVIAYMIGLSSQELPVETKSASISKIIPVAKMAVPVVPPPAKTVTTIVKTPYGSFTTALPPGATMGAEELRSLSAVDLARLILRDPQKGLAELAKLPQGPDTDKTYYDIFFFWSNDKKDSNAAPQAAATAYALPAGKDRNIALQAVIQNWANQDPTSLLDWAGTIGATDSETLKNALTDVASKDGQPALAAQYVDQLTNATARNQAISTIATAMAQADPAGTLAWLDQEATGNTYDNSVTSLISNLAKQDPAQAATLVGNITEPDVQATAIANVAGTWGATNPQAVLVWLNSLPDSESAARNAGLSSAIAAWAQSDPTAALAYVQNAPDPSIYFNAAPAIAGALSQSNPQAALNWTNSLPTGASKDQALSNVLDNMGQTDFNTAWSDASNLPSGDGRDLAMESLVGVEAETNPTQAVTILGQFPVGSTQQLSATGQLAAAWVGQNPNAFIQWASALPPGDQQNAAMTAAINAVKAEKNSVPRNQLFVKLLRAQNTMNGLPPDTNIPQRPPP